jgi:hypothetical protein
MNVTEVITSERCLREPHGRHADDHVELRLEVDGRHPRPRDALHRRRAPVVFVGSTVPDILDGYRTGRIAMIQYKGAAPIENESTSSLYGRGVRMIGVTASRTSSAAGSKIRTTAG